MLPEDRESWQWQEVKAFRKGERAIDEFFETSGVPFSEQRRRQATPILLEANPKHFVISVSVTAGVLDVQDGRHRLAIATMAGLGAVNVQVVYPPLHQDRAMYREIKRRGGVEMVFPPLLTPRPQSRLTFSKDLSTRTIPVFGCGKLGIAS
jgi:hypothetical protein